MNEEGTNHDAGRTWFDRIAHALMGEPSSRSELIDVLRDAEQRNILDPEALSIIEGALQVSDMRVKEIMIPRSQVVMISLSMQLEELLPLVTESGHSRFPVYDDGPDDVVGILLAKDLLPLALGEPSQRFNLREILRPPTAVPESKRLNILLQDFRSTRNHLAVVYDEYGGVAGIVTIEDVLEQIVGEIEDEYDIDEEAYIKPQGPNSFTIKALTPIDDFNEYFKTHFSDEEFDTIGGIVTNSIGHLPKRGESVAIEGLRFKVLNADNRRIRLLQLVTGDQEESE